MKESKLNRGWHHEHQIPTNTKMEQWLKWHFEHTKYCGCRSIPIKVAEKMKKREIATHSQDAVP
jgi:hypothetical protein